MTALNRYRRAVRLTKRSLKLGIASGRTALVQAMQTQLAQLRNQRPVAFKPHSDVAQELRDGMVVGHNWQKTQWNRQGVSA